MQGSGLLYKIANLTQIACIALQDCPGYCLGNHAMTCNLIAFSICDTVITWKSKDIPDNTTMHCDKTHVSNGKLCVFVVYVCACVCVCVCVYKHIKATLEFGVQFVDNGNVFHLVLVCQFHSIFSTGRRQVFDELLITRF